MADVVLINGTGVRIEPKSQLELNASYHVVVTTDVKDLAGNYLATEYVGGSFTTVIDSTELEVTGISAISSFAQADNSFENGWKWKFYVTAPTNENSLRMKFADFASGSNVITADNIRFYSAQSENANSADNAIAISEAESYSSFMYLTEDLDAEKMGRQIEIIVEVRVPEGSVGGSYSTSYGISTFNEET